MTEPPPHPLLHGFRPHALLAALVLAVYAQTLGFGLTLLDDDHFLGEKFAFLSRASNLPKLFVRGALLGASGEDYYRPLLTMSIMIDALLGGRSLVLFHATNIAIHALASCLVFALFRKTGHGERSLLLATLFAVHPVLAQSVAWMPGRTDSLLAVFLLASFLAFLDHLEAGRTRSLILHLFFFALALLVKELAIVLPAVCLAWTVLRAPAGSMNRRRGVVLAGAWLVLLAAWFTVRSAVLTGSSVSSISSLASNLPAAGLYWGKGIVPVRLSPYPILADASWIPAAAALLIAGGALVFTRRRDYRGLAWGAFWFAVFLLPSFLDPEEAITPVFFEYRAYLPLIGLLFILAGTDLAAGFTLAMNPRSIAWIAVVLAFAGGAIVNSRSYRGAVPHWERAVEISPRSAFAHRQLGVAALLEGDAARAEREYRAALALNPREPMAHNNLGTLHLKSGRLDEARKEYLAELDFRPRDAHALFNLGLVALEQGRHDEAAALWARTLEADPDFIDAYVNLSGIHLLRGDLDRATRLAREALQRGGTLPPDLERQLPGLRQGR